MASGVYFVVQRNNNIINNEMMYQIGNHTRDNFASLKNEFMANKTMEKKSLLWQNAFSQWNDHLYSALTTFIFLSYVTQKKKKIIQFLCGFILLFLTDPSNKIEPKNKTM